MRSSNFSVEVGLYSAMFGLLSHPAHQQGAPILPLWKPLQRLSISYSKIFYLSNATFYKYKPLKHADAIRILKLHPSADPRGPLFCTIKHVRLPDPDLTYEAISYTWGDAAAQKETVYLENGHTKLEIGINGYQALRDLRSSTENRYLWMDAVCIDQGDVDERGHQVKLMHWIYRRALKVIVHLGVHTDGSRILFEELVKNTKAGGFSAWLHGTRNRPSERVAEEMDALFERPWFKRVWVLQEVHANRAVYIMCGSDMITSATFEDCYMGYGNGRITQRMWPLPMQLRDLTNSRASEPTRQLFWKYLFDGRSCLASDPRDKVFAVISLLGEKRVAVDHLIDYHESVEKVFVNTAVECIPVIGLEMLNAIR